MSESFTESELTVIAGAKRAMTIVAKIIRDKDLKEVFKDPDLADEIGDKTLERSFQLRLKHSE